MMPQTNKSPLSSCAALSNKHLRGDTWIQAPSKPEPSDLGDSGHDPNLIFHLTPSFELSVQSSRHTMPKKFCSSSLAPCYCYFALLNPAATKES